MDFKYWELENLERGLKSNSEEALYNIYRTLKINEKIDGKYINSPYELFDLMRDLDIPYFKGDERLFFEIYVRLSGFTKRQMIDYAYFIMCKGGFGAMIPEPLFNVLFSNIKNYKSILVTDCEKYSVQFYDLIKENNNIKFYLTVKNEIIEKIYKILFNDLNVEFINPDFYTYEFTVLKFDLIISFPVMGGRELNYKSDFISRELSFIAAQNLLYHITPNGKLFILLPAKIGFGGGDAEILRHYISENYKVVEVASLPSRLFYPYMSINTYLLIISQGQTDAVNFSKFNLNKNDEFNELKLEDSRLLFTDELEDMNSWNVDLAFSMTDETILQYKDSAVKKMKLKEVAEVFRGKAVSGKSENGNIGVVNISNLEEIGIDYDNLDFIEEEERKVARYLLKDGDVLITTKGFTIKICVFENQNRLIIPSSNLCVIRPNEKIMSGTYLKLFLESDTGMKLLKSLQRGTTIININYQDICEIEVPAPPLDEQLSIANEYNAGLSLYKKTISAAEKAWKMIKNNVKNKLF